MVDFRGEVVICGSGGSDTNDDCPAGMYCHVGSSPENTNCCALPNDNKTPCDQPLNIGNGGEHLERWFFDSMTKQCKQFIYAGLKGNLNNFLSKELCSLTCTGK